MLKLQKNKIIMTRGDSAYFGLKVKIPQFPYEEYKLKENDKCVFTCRKLQFWIEGEQENPILFQFEIEKDLVKILPEYTRELPYGDYYYDIELTMGDGQVHTIIEPTLLKLTREVGC